MANADGSNGKHGFCRSMEGIECDFRELGYIISSSFPLLTENSGLCWEFCGNACEEREEKLTKMNESQQMKERKLNYRER